MKKSFLVILTLVILFACKKEGSGGGNGKMLLSKVYMNDLLYREYIYSSEDRLIRENNFATGAGQSKLSTYRMFEYNADGTIDEEYHYSNAHVAVVQRTYLYNALGKVSKIDEAVDYSGSADFEDIDYTYAYDYDNKGRLVKVISREADLTPRWYESFSYDENDNLVYYDFQDYDDNNHAVMKQKTEIVPGGKIPQHWKGFLLEPTDFNFYEMYITSKKYTSYWILPATNTEYAFTNRVYEEGYLVSQTLEAKSKSGNFSNDYKYTYVLQ